MNKNFLLSATLGVLVMSCASKPEFQPKKIRGVKMSWFGAQEKQFVKDLESTFNRLNAFLKDQNLSQMPIENFIDEIIHFESKELFDSEMTKLTNGKMKIIPKTYVAVGDGGVLRTISFEAYLKIHPDHNRKDFVDILVHEAAHIFHSKTYGNEGMGPVWFFEGFAVVAADQYINEARLSKDEMKAVAAAKERGDYKQYGFMVRELKKTHSLGDMLQKAKNDPNKFLSYLGLK